MPTLRPFLVPIQLLAAALLATGACSVGDNGSQETSCIFGPSCVAPDAAAASDGSQTVVDAAMSPTASDDAAVGVCGSGQCNPDDESACRDFVEPEPALLEHHIDGGPVDEELQALADDAALRNEDASALDASDVTYGDAGADAADAEPAFDGGDEVGADAALDAQTPDVGQPESPAFGCQVNAVKGKLRKQCGQAGRGFTGAECKSNSECAAGYGCVTEAEQGRCFKYCCAAEDACAAGTYCALRPLYQEPTSVASRQEIPVCALADNCRLDEPFPCDGEDCTCLSGTSCTVVRADGTTSCVHPGQGELGEACPCAPGFLCSQATSTCLKLCDARDAENPCAAGRCQTTPAFPEGWGVCVGMPPQAQ